ncbi:MAG: acyltransferase, partial [Streptosporangiaceae bacterium]
MRSRQDNAFDLLRLVGAVGVVAQHSWVLAGSGDPMGPFKGVSLMVDAFFAASGYLITSSWLADPSARRFGLRRALRIYPAYAVVIVLAALVVGPLATDLSPGAYFGNPLTWEYLGKNLLILPMTYDLPGVFTGNPLPLVVNGSLWSLRLEMICYVLVALLGLARLVNLRVVSVLLVAMVTITVLVHATGHPGVLVPHLLLGSHAEQISLFL